MKRLQRLIELISIKTKCCLLKLEELKLLTVNAKKKKETIFMPKVLNWIGSDDCGGCVIWSLEMSFSLFCC